MSRNPPKENWIAPEKTMMSREQLCRELEKATGLTVHLVLTRNRRSLVSVRSLSGGRVEVRVQEAFCAADPKTVKALARFIQKPGDGPGKLLSEFVENQAELFASRARQPRKRTIRIRSKGVYRDLRIHRDRVIRGHGLDIPNEVPIGWGRFSGSRKKKAARRSIRFGSYSPDPGYIKIHPILDDPKIPEYFLEYVIFHELLHILFPPKLKGGKRSVHGREFKAMEKRYRDYERAVAFEKAFIKTRLSDG